MTNATHNPPAVTWAACTTTLWGVPEPQPAICSTLKRATALAAARNAERQPGDPAAVPVELLAVVIASPDSAPGCEVVALDIPRDLWREFTARANASGLDTSRLVSSMILSHVQTRGPSHFGAGLVRVLTDWENSKRQFRPWHAADEVQP